VSLPKPVVSGVVHDADAHSRGLATRYDKHVTICRGALVLAAALTWIADLGDTS